MRNKFIKNPFKLFCPVILVTCIVLLTSCSQDDEDLNTMGGGGNVTQCSVDTTLLTNIVWQPPISAFATLEFNTSGIYYENGSDDGNWSFTNGCDSIYVTRPSNSFYFRILTLTENTLVLHTDVFGDVTYTH